MEKVSGWMSSFLDTAGVKYNAKMLCSVNKYVIPSNNLQTLKIRFITSEDVDISGLPLFFAAVGSSLKKLTISAAEVDVDVKMVLERCPNLEQFCLTNRQMDAAVFNFSDYHVAGTLLPAITFNLEDIPAFTEELMKPDSALTRCLKRLTIFQNSYRPNRNLTRPQRELKRDLDALLKVLDNNEDLEYLCVGLYREFHEYVERFQKYHLQPINRSVKLDVESKIAFLSVLSTTRPPRNETRTRGCHLENKRMNWEDLDANVVTNIFQFAAAPVMRKTYLMLRHS